MTSAVSDMCLISLIAQSGRSPMGTTMPSQVRLRNAKRIGSFQFGYRLKYKMTRKLTYGKQSGVRRCCGAVSMKDSAITNSSNTSMNAAETAKLLDDSAALTPPLGYGYMPPRTRGDLDRIAAT